MPPSGSLGVAADHLQNGQWDPNTPCLTGAHLYAIHKNQILMNGKRIGSQGELLPVESYPVPF
jgi:hypothetical protein